MRVRTLLTSGKSVDPEILSALTDLLGTAENAYVLTRAVEVLAHFRHRAAVPAIRELLGHRDRNLSKAAFDAVVEMGGGFDEETLRPLLGSEDADVRLRAADTLRRMDSPEGFTVVVEVLREGSDLERRDAAEVLGGFRTGEAVPPLLDALLDRSSTVRSQARTSLQLVLGSLFPYRRLDLGSTGYSYTGPDAPRKAAVERIRRWWEENREKDW
jgi:HEAT repeat protein